MPPVTASRVADVIASREAKSIVAGDPATPARVAVADSALVERPLGVGKDVSVGGGGTVTAGFVPVCLAVSSSSVASPVELISVIPVTVCVGRVVL